jgi:hypothetical protein
MIIAPVTLTYHRFYRIDNSENLIGNNGQLEGRGFKYDKKFPIFPSAGRFTCFSKGLHLWTPRVYQCHEMQKVFKDPTSHDLWPLEFIIAAVIGFSVALAGALLGRLLGFAWKKVLT